MALIKCPECGKEISEYANWCPNCGCPSSHFPARVPYGTILDDGCYYTENIEYGEKFRDSTELRFFDNDMFIQHLFLNGKDMGEQKGKYKLIFTTYGKTIVLDYGRGFDENSIYVISQDKLRLQHYMKFTGNNYYEKLELLTYYSDFERCKEIE